MSTAPSDAIACDLVGGQHRRIDASEPREAAEQPARGRERLVVARNVERQLEIGRRRDNGRVGFPAEGRSGSEKTLKILLGATSTSRSGASRTTLPM